MLAEHSDVLEATFGKSLAGLRMPFEVARLASCQAASAAFSETL